MEVRGPECVCVVERTTFCSVYTPGYSWSSLSRAYFFTIWPIIPEQMVTYATTENSAKYSNSKRAVNNLSHRNFGQTWPKRAGKVCLATSCKLPSQNTKHKYEYFEILPKTSVETWQQCLPQHIPHYLVVAISPLLRYFSTLFFKTADDTSKLFSHIRIRIRYGFQFK